MIVVLWRYRVPAATLAAFEAAYGPAGDWVRLFERADGYAGSELLRLADAAGSYMTFDRWHSAADYERAKALLADDYATLDRRCAAFTSEEVPLGLHDVIA